MVISDSWLSCIVRDSKAVSPTCIAKGSRLAAAGSKSHRLVLCRSAPGHWGFPPARWGAVDLAVRGHHA